ncbi:MAG: hypothetical protein KatS3mg057_1923 [Herpetosiphonaceae bacterium]|nr:MAG: hypothetical protein KatS3mg057_1923 [Herpetosiphonaceae bacterium]
MNENVNPLAQAGEQPAFPLGLKPRGLRRVPLGQPAPGTPASIFRADALWHYRQGSQRAILPRLVAPRTFLWLWALLALLVASAGALWLVRVPVYAMAQTVIVDGRRISPELNADVVVVAFVPPEQLAHLRPGQALFLNLDSAGRPLRQSIIAVESEMFSPAAARTRFALDPGTAASIRQPVAVALARLEDTPLGIPPSAYVGGTYQATVEVGSRRALALVPIIGRLFGD